MCVNARVLLILTKMLRGKAENVSVAGGGRAQARARASFHFRRGPYDGASVAAGNVGLVLPKSADDGLFSARFSRHRCLFKNNNNNRGKHSIVVLYRETNRKNMFR